MKSVKQYSWISVIMLGLFLLVGCNSSLTVQPGVYEKSFPETMESSPKSINLEEIMPIADSLISEYFSEYVYQGIAVNMSLADYETAYEQVSIIFRQINGQRIISREYRCNLGIVKFDFITQTITIFIDEERDLFSWDLITLDYQTTEQWQQIEKLFVGYIEQHQLGDVDCYVSQTKDGWYVAADNKSLLKIDSKTLEIIEFSE